MALRTVPRRALKNGQFGACYPGAAYCGSIVAAPQSPHRLTTGDWVSSYSAMLQESRVWRLRQEAGADPHHAEPYHTVRLLGGASQLHLGETRQ